MTALATLPARLTLELRGVDCASEGPMSLTTGVGKAAEHGVLIRSGEALQGAQRLDTIVLDKTGTITGDDRRPPGPHRQRALHARVRHRPRRRSRPVGGPPRASR